MAKNAKVVLYTFDLWQKLVSWAYNVSHPDISFLFSFLLDALSLLFCSFNVSTLSARSSWLHATPLPSDCYLSPRIPTLFQQTYILAILEAVLCSVSIAAFTFTMFRRETTYTENILVIGVIAISIALAAVGLALQTLVSKSLLDVEAILRIRPDLSSEDVLNAWAKFTDGKLPLVVFIFLLFAGVLQIWAVSARHLIPSSRRLPKQHRPFIVEKTKRMPAIRESEASTLGTEMLPRVEPGPLARLFDDYERRGLISTQVDLEVCQSNKAITSSFLHGLYRLSSLPDLKCSKGR